MTITINLPPQLEALVRQKVASGRYASASEVIREALQLLEQGERLREAKLNQMRQDVDGDPSSDAPVDWDCEHVKRTAWRGNAKHQD